MGDGSETIKGYGVSEDDPSALFLPQRIPTHFNFSGQIDGYGAKAILWLYPALMAVSFGLLLLVERRPRSWNTGVRVTPYNQSFVYRTLKSMIVTLELCLVGI